MTGSRLCLIVALVFALSIQAGASGLPLIVQIPPTANINTIATALGGSVVDSIPDANTYLLDVPSMPLPGVAALLGIEDMELNTAVSLPPVVPVVVFPLKSGVAADWYKYQPAMLVIGAPSAWSYSKGRGVVVADINSQVDFSHPALVGHLTSGYDFVTTKPAGPAALNQSSAGFMDQSSAGFMDQSSAGFMDQSSAGFMDQSSAGFMDSWRKAAYSHGTLCAGVIAAVAPDSMVMPLRVFDDDGNTEIFSIVKAIRYAVRNGAQVINMSFGTLENSKSLKKAIDFAKNSQVVLVASAGNSNTSSPQYPAAYSGVLTTAATDIFDVKGSFSNYGPSVVVDAPGVSVISAFPGGLYSVANGTSFSAPAVAGTAALIRSLRATGVSFSITSTSVNIDSKNPSYAGQLGYGRIDVLRAVNPN